MIEERVLPKRHTSTGWCVTRIHHSSVPGYDIEEARKGLSKASIQTELECNWMASAGKVVYPEFSETLHIAPHPLPFDPHRQLILGLDVPGTPAAIISQINVFDQWCILRNLSPPEDEALGYYEFFETLAEVLLREFAEPVDRDLETLNLKFYGDPAGNAPIPKPGQAPKEARSCFDILRNGIKLTVGVDERGTERVVEKPGWGWHVVPGDVSEVKRIAAVGARLSTLLRGGLPAIQIDPGCRTVIEGFGGAYHYPELSGGRGFEPHPKKDFWSHTMNALEYPATRLFAHKEKKEPGESTRRPHVSRAAARSTREGW